MQKLLAHLWWSASGSRGFDGLSYEVVSGEKQTEPALNVYICQSMKNGKNSLSEFNANVRNEAIIPFTAVRAGPRI